MEEKIKEHYSPYGQPEATNDLKDRIVSALKQAGKDIQNLEIKDLSIIDQLHTGGHLATIEIVKKAGLNPGAKILDAGCGIGGSSRLLANKFQLKVTGIDIVDEFIQTAGFLTDLVEKNYNLNNLVEFNQGSILELPLPDGIYDAVLSQHTLMNIKEKDVLFNEFNRVLKPGALLLLHEVVKKEDIPIDLPVPWAASYDISFLNTWDVLLKICQNAGFELVYYSDKAEQAEQWWVKVKEVTEKFAENPRPLGPHIIFGENGKKFGKTMTSNVQTNRINVIEAVLKKH
ncbi:MAG: class I SAM-dependent methyltransferase [Desulfobacteraceae bacterium]|nr:class I SAM-dependent methyltransferase [Desulfobacteraceae bacterium]